MRTVILPGTAELAAELMGKHPDLVGARYLVVVSAANSDELAVVEAAVAAHRRRSGERPERRPRHR
jgi:hypothetical protein